MTDVDANLIHERSAQDHGQTIPSRDEVRDPLVGFMLGIAINRLRGRVSLFEPEFTNEQIAEALETAGTKRRLFDLDDLHHAPACRANRWSGQCLPTGPCTCGARALRAREAQPSEQSPSKSGPPKGWTPDRSWSNGNE